MGIKISELESTTIANANDVFIINQGGATKKITKDDLQNQIGNPELEERVDVLEEEVEALQNQVTNLEETVNSELEDGTAEGTEITVNDSANADCSLLPNGNTSQNQYEGYNLFNSDSYPVSKTYHGVAVTNNGDGSFTLNGTCNANNISFFLGSNATIQEYSAESIIIHTAYYVSGNCTKAGSANTSCVLRLNWNDSATMIPLEQLKNSITISKRKGISTSTTGWDWGIKIDAGDTFDNFTIKYMLVKGTEELPYEPYVGGQASPNPKYTQEVQVLKGSNTIKVSNKNRFIGSLRQGSISSRGSHVASTTRLRHDNYIKVRNNEAYIFNADSNNEIQIIPMEYDKEQNFVRRTFDTFQNIPCRFTTDSNTEYIKILIRYTSNDTILPEAVTNCQLESGQTATAYEPHKEQNLPLTLPEGMEMCKIRDYADEFIYQDNKWHKYVRIQKRIFNGTEANWDISNTGTEGYFYRRQLENLAINEGNNKNLLFCNQLKWGQVYSQNTNQGIYIVAGETSSQLRIRYGEEKSIEDFKADLANNNLILYFVRLNPVLEEITDETLISELEELLKIRTYYGQTNITVESEDLPPMMTLNYKKSNRLTIDNRITELERAVVALQSI